MRKIWNIRQKDKEKAAALAAELGVSALLAGILLNRGIDNAAAAREFLHPEEREYYDPYLLPDMDKAVKRIRAAIEAREQIVVYGDYDADGITATTVLLRTLQQLGGWADYYIPDRFTEGYGVNLEALKRMHRQGTSLVITVDCGIKSVEELRQMQDCMDFVVTDHHLPGDELPPAVAVIDAHRQDSKYPCGELAGVGIAFKLCQALWLAMKKVPAENPGLEIVALGTVADAVPLVDENRKIVAEGLKRMKDSSFVGIRALIEATGLGNREIDSMGIGFVLAPRINVAGRLKSARLSVELLLSENEDMAREMAGKLNELNNTRKELKEEIQAMAEEQLKSMDIGNARVIVVAGEEWHHGVLGLVASSLQEKYYLPTIVISVKDGIGKGSCRSIPGFNLFKALTSCQSALVQFGGHEMAAGLTVRAENIDLLQELLEAEARRQMTAAQYIPCYDIDMEISPAEMTMEMVEELSLLEPCGMKNEPPLFGCRGLSCLNPELKGADARHLKFTVSDRGRLVDAIAFNMPEELARVARGGFDMVYAAGINEWRDMRSLQCMVRSLDEPVPVQEPVAVDRDFMRQIYVFLRSRVQGGHRLSADLGWLAMQARLEGCRAEEQNVADAVTVLLELGLLKKTPEGYLELSSTAKKMDLYDSPTFRRLNS